MNKLLPNIYELKPISGNRNTFGETVFILNFNDLSFKEKLMLNNFMKSIILLMKKSKECCIK